MTLQISNMDCWKQNKLLRVHRGILIKSAMYAQHTFSLSVERPEPALQHWDMKSSCVETLHLPY